MAKLLTPLLSLGAKGTLGDRLTFQRLPGVDIVKKKPLPAYRYTLPQAYHRWLYQDYLNLWASLSTAGQREYAAAGGRTHNTGVGELMRSYLKTLPDLLGVWHLDERSGAIAYDSSGNGNDGTIIGAMAQVGLIDYERWFDGIDDRITIPDSTSLDTTEEITIMFFAYLDAYSSFPRCAINRRDGGLDRWRIRTRYGRYYAYLYDQAGNPIMSLGAFAVDFPQYRHVAVTYNSAGTGTLFIDGVIRVQIVQAHTNLGTGGVITIGRRGDGVYPWHDGLDEVRLYNRALTQAEIIPFVTRRFPAK